MISGLRKVGSLADKLRSTLEALLENSTYNNGAGSLRRMNLTVPTISNMYEQYLEIKKRILFLTKSNSHYRGSKFFPDSSSFSKVSCLPDLSQKLISFLKSSPPEPTLLSLNLSNRPVLGPYRKEGDGRTMMGQFKNGVRDGLVLYVDSAGGSSSDKQRTPRLME